MEEALQSRSARFAVARQPVEHRIAMKRGGEKTRDARRILVAGAPDRRLAMRVHMRSERPMAMRQEKRIAAESSG